MNENSYYRNSINRKNKSKKKIIKKRKKSKSFTRKKKAFTTKAKTVFCFCACTFNKRILSFSVSVFVIFSKDKKRGGEHYYGLWFISISSFSNSQLILSHSLHQLPADDVIFLAAAPSSLSSSLLFFSIKVLYCFCSFFSYGLKGFFWFWRRTR